MSDDLELWGAWAAGDTSAGKAFAARHFLGVYRFFESKVGPEADDLTQRTFLAFLEAYESYRQGGSVRAFLFGIARRQLLRHYEGRDDRGRQRVDLSQVTAADLLPSPSQLIAERERTEALFAALRRIPIDFQIALELYYWTELDVAEIAEVLAVAPGTVKSRLARARDKLRAALAELDPAHPTDDDSLARATRRLGR